MKDIKENQQGLKSLAAEKPDVVKKMGYDPESFYAGGLAMLAAGWEATTNMDPVSYTHLPLPPIYSV